MFQDTAYETHYIKYKKNFVGIIGIRTRIARFKVASPNQLDHDATRLYRDLNPNCAIQSRES